MQIIDKETSWLGNTKSVFSTMGASNHSTAEREVNDYYATCPSAVRMLLEIEKFEGGIWECACGEGHLSKEMKRLGYKVFSSDIVSRGYEDKIIDFTSSENNRLTSLNIITNPPFKYANLFILKAISLLRKGNKLALFLPIRYLEGRERKQTFLAHPPKIVHVSSGRIDCAKNGEFSKNSRSAMAYSWFIWEKGYVGSTEIKWFN